MPHPAQGNVHARADVCLAILKPIELYKTTYPNKVFDYMAAGKPVLLAIDGVIRTVVDSAKAGLFVPPGDSQKLAETARAFMANPALCKRMGVAGRGYIEQNYSRSLIADQFHDLLLSLRRKNG